MSLPVGALVDWPGDIQAPVPPLIKRMCYGILRDGERHDLVLGWTVCTPAQAGEISWVFCPACFARWEDQFAADKGDGAEGGRHTREFFSKS